MQAKSLKLPLPATKIKKAKLATMVKYAVVFIVFIVTSFASVNMGSVAGFAFGIYFALLVFGFNMLTTSALYVLGYSLAHLNLVSLYIAVPMVLSGLIMAFIYKRLHRQANKYVAMLFALLGNVGFVYYNVSTPQLVVSTIVTVALGELFLFACIHFFSATLYKGFNIKLNLDQIISGSLLVIVFSMGMAAINLWGIEFIKIFGVVCILLATYIFPSFTALFVGSLIGIGGAIYLNSLTIISVFVLFGLVSIAFKSNNKIFACLSILFCEILFGLYFNVYQTFTVFSLVSILIAEIIFLLLPTKFINSIGDKLGGIKEKVALRNIINHSKEGITNKMYQLSNVFSEMDTVFRNMVKGVLPQEDAKKMITSEVIEKISKNNPETLKALRMDAKTTLSVFGDLVNVGFERGKVTLLDVPQYITSKIGKVNYLINTINQLLGSYKHYSVMITNMDTSRLLIADQLSGISTILKNLAQEVNLNITFDLSKETRIVEELAYNNIYCVEAIVYEQNAHVLNTTLVIKESDVKTETIEKVVSKIVKSILKVVNIAPSTVAGCSVVTLKTRPNHDIIFGSASAGKTNEMVSGDTHSLIKIDDGKYMVALCDGMGSGENANLTSNLSISLIENFYKAGFENEIILHSVNKLLAQNSEENFAAMDICIIDTQKGICDFIKLGSPQGYIKHKSTTEVIETCGLPMGILEEMQPHITKKVLTDFDIIILASDGVTDSFYNNSQDLKLFINNLSVYNPQTIADQILERAVDLNNGICTDDMTVLAVRVYMLE